MEKTKKQKNHESDMVNANEGTPGTNGTYKKNQANRVKQLELNQRPKK